MPEEVAKRVLSKYFSTSWLNKPTGREIIFWCSGEFPLPIDSIKMVQIYKFGDNANKSIVVANYSFDQAAAYLPRGCGQTVQYLVRVPTPLTEDEINDITDAFASLGAKIQEIKRN